MLILKFSSELCRQHIIIRTLIKIGVINCLEFMVLEISDYIYN